jgi:hypothetical protein
MTIDPHRRLLQRDEVLSRLQLSEEDLDLLIHTCQLRPISICGRERFDSKDLNHLIDTYIQTQSKRSNHG